VSRTSRRRGAGTERVVVGLHPVRELLRAGRPVRRIHVADRDPSDVLADILDLADTAGVPVEQVDRDRLDDLATGLVHQGVVALAPPFEFATLDAVLAGVRSADEVPFLVALDHLTDPHNVGSIVRTAEAVGAHGLIVPTRRSVGVTPAVEKAAAGALAHVPLVRVSNIDAGLRALSEAHVWSVGLDADASMSIERCTLLTEPVVLVVGSEGRGLAHLSQVRCDQLVRLPMRGSVGSLNASVAAAVAMYEVLRQRAAGRS
jgi:23S rRNA (guanosine2251-2'-O)-methyltransferase